MTSQRWIAHFPSSSCESPALNTVVAPHVRPSCPVRPARMPRMSGLHAPRVRWRTPTSSNHPGVLGQWRTGSNGSRVLPQQRLKRTPCSRIALGICGEVSDPLARSHQSGQCRCSIPSADRYPDVGMDQQVSKPLCPLTEGGNHEIAVWIRSSNHFQQHISPGTGASANVLDAPPLNCGLLSVVER